MSETAADVQIGLDVSELNKGLQSMQSALVAIGATKVFDFLADQVEACVKASIEFESALAGVAKTTDLSEKELSDYADAIKDMATKIPLTTTELLGISEAAGQLGISGSKNLLIFTETMAKLGTATNMTADQAATMLAQFANITSMSTDDYSRLGSTIVALGNSSATTESAITEMAQGMAASATNAGISEAKILAMSAAAASVGIQAAAGSTSFSTLISKMQTAVETGDKLDAWAEASGMSADEFVQAWQTDAAGAVDKFITGLKEQDKQGKSMTLTLKALGITEIRQQRLVQSLANSEGLLTKSLKTASDAWEDDTALNKEAATRYATTESKIQLLENRFGNLKTTIGDQLAPAFNGLLDVLSIITEGITEFAEENEWLGPVIAGVAAGLMVLVGAITAVTIATKLLDPELKKLLATMLTNPIFLVIAAIAAATVAIIAWTSEMAKASKEMEGYSSKAKQMAEDSENLSDSIQDVASANAQSERSMQSYMKIIDDLGSKSNRTQKEQWQLEYAIEELNKICPDLALTIEDVNDGLSENAKRAIEAAEAEGEYQAILDKQKELQKTLIDAEVTQQAAEEELTRQKAALTDAQITEAEAYVENLKNMDSSGEAMQAMLQYYFGLDEETRTYINSLREYGEVQASCEETIRNATDAQAALGEKTEEITGLTEEQKAAMEETGIASEEEAAQILQSAQNQAKAMDDLTASYWEAKSNAVESLNDQIDKWHKLEKQDKITTSTIIDGYKQQAKVMKEFGSNLESLNSRNIDGLREWITANNDGSAEFQAAVAGMADASDEEIAEMIASWEESQTAMDNTAGSMAQLATDYDDEAQRIKESTQSWVDNLSQEQTAYLNTQGTLQQVEAAARDMQGPISDAYSNVANAAVSQLRSKLTAKFKVSTSYNSTGDTAYVSAMPQYDTGGLITKPQIALIAEKRPEFVGARDDLEAFIDSAVSKAIISPNEALNRNISGSIGTNNTTIEVNVPISVSKELSDTDIRRKAKEISAVVSKEFSATAGGRL